MPKIMLINATRTEEVRAAILNDGTLEQFEIEVQDAGLLKGNIYRGVVANVEASLNACFVDIGADKQGFLPIDEIHPSCWHEQPKKKDARPRIEEVMRKGGEIVVQVVKDAVGNKGSALTTQISLAGRYIVLMPLDDSRGVSRRIADDGRRKKVKEIASDLKIPEEYGFIVRTAGTERTKADLNRDAAHLVRTWKDIEKSGATAKRGRNNKQRRGGGREPLLLFEDRDLVVRMIRDYHTADVTEILIDNADAFLKAREYVRTVMPRSHKAIALYDERMPLFSKYRVEEQIESVFARRVDLPSGGYILIDPTEALTSIDVNSGRSTRAKSQEETAVNTNMEAAAEIARQLRLRDLGGLIVVDFIDMPANKQNRAVEKALKDSLKADKARTYIGKISENGLLEVNRQRIKQALQFQTHRPCPMCEGTGTIPTPEFVSLGLLRKIEAKAASGLIDKAVVGLHPEIATFVTNARRRDLVELEDRFGIIIRVEGRAELHRNQTSLNWQSLSQLSDWERHELEVRREALAARAEGEAVHRREALMLSDEQDAELEAMLAAEDAEDEADRAAMETKRLAEEHARGPGGRADARRDRRSALRTAQLHGEELVLPAADDEDEEDDEDASEPVTAGPRVVDEAASPASPADDAGGDEASGKRRKRRRRRRKQDGATAASDGASGDEDDDDDEDEDEAPPTNGRKPTPTVLHPGPLPVLTDIAADAPGTVLVPPPADGIFGDA